jgi:cell wall-associated NlpC family hydrolase
MPVLRPDQIYGVCLQAGFTPEQAVTWTAIAMAESGGNSDAHNPHGESSWGLWQVNVAPGVRENHWGDLTNPVNNARAAYEISNHGTNMRPWTVTHESNAGTNKDYRNFMDEARAASGGQHQGDFSGVTGYHDPSGTGGPGGADVMHPPGTGGFYDTGLDSDHDGASDAYEMSHGTDPHLPDSDHDGLTDGFELSHGLDAHNVDSDHDGLSDLREIRLGTNPLAADTDHDGVNDAMEVAMHRDPLHGIAVDHLHVAGAGLDSDHDGLSDAMELSFHLDPHSADSDHDGISDAMEALHHTTPLATTPLAAHPLEVSPLDPMAHHLDPGAALAGPAGAHPEASGTLQHFLDAAVAQTGDHYVFGAEASPTNANPNTFDCSELTQWAAGRVGVHLPDGSWLQYLQLRDQGAVIPVEDAIHRPGALLFSFDREPTAGGGRPGEAHVAISLGDGKTIEARNPHLGVGSWEANSHRFQYAAIIPGLSGEALPPPAEDLSHLPQFHPDPMHPIAGMGPGEMPVDSDHDGVTDVYEMSHGTDPHNPDSDHDGLTDGFELLHGANPAGPGMGPVLDSDHDGLSDSYELTHGTDPHNADSDHDGITDAQELLQHRDPLHGVPLDHLDPGHHPLDSDHDGLSDAFEASLGTNPHDHDSDHDGLSDAFELLHHTNPHDPDSDHDGVLDGHAVHDHHMEWDHPHH